MSETEERGRENEEGAEEAERVARIERGMLVVREGHGANCSSIGSVVDTLFAGAILGGVIFAAVAAALAREEKVRVVGAGAKASESARTTDEESPR